MEVNILPTYHLTQLLSQQFDQVKSNSKNINTNYLDEKRKTAILLYCNILNYVNYFIQALRTNNQFFPKSFIRAIYESTIDLILIAEEDNYYRCIQLNSENEKKKLIESILEHSKTNVYLKNKFEKFDLESTQKNIDILKKISGVKIYKPKDKLKLLKAKSNHTYDSLYVMYQAMSSYVHGTLHIMTEEYKFKPNVYEMVFNRDCNQKQLDTLIKTISAFLYMAENVIDKIIPDLMDKDLLRAASEIYKKIVSPTR